MHTMHTVHTVHAVHAMHAVKVYCASGCKSAKRRHQQGLYQAGNYSSSDVMSHSWQVVSQVQQIIYIEVDFDIFRVLLG